MLADVLTDSLCKINLIVMKFESSGCVDGIVMLGLVYSLLDVKKLIF